ncbi:uncharacterized protein LOC135975208 isoform X2 [Chrysemys picta bellii]|uniref:uncharacterized protein LOC135975208 isoform X2 n=1 Tax=Chrysemys picta bellii TaxID=8478 RepID=UPI0032B2AEFF
MELTFLLPVLASLQIFPSLVSPTAPLSAPTLSLHPPHPEFFEGERLTLRCSAPRAAEPTGYRFFDQSGERLFKTPPDLYREAQLHLTAQLATTGAYSCAYWRGASGQETPSEKSQPVSVQVKDAPAAPSLSLNPRRRVYRAGDSVGLVCSAPPSVDKVKGFQYFGDRIAVLALASSKKNYTYNLNITGPTVFGSYSCSYWVRVSGRNVPARRSEPVVISMRGEPCQSVIPLRREHSTSAPFIQHTNFERFPCPLFALCPTFQSHLRTCALLPCWAFWRKDSCFHFSFCGELESLCVFSRVQVRRFFNKTGCLHILNNSE